MLFVRGEERVLVQQSPDAVAVVASATKTETAFLTRDDVLNTFVLNEPQDLEQLLQTVATAWKSAAIAQPDCR